MEQTDNQSFSNQPMSLMTIEADQRRGASWREMRTNKAKEREEKEADLLTLRILEASEQKMQLIRKLLTPEEYNSLSSDLFTTPRDFVKSTQSLHNSNFKFNNFSQLSKEENITNNSQGWTDRLQAESIPISLSAATRSKRSLWLASKSYSKSEVQLTSQKSGGSKPAAATFGGVQENLAKKRLAIDFFFLDAPGRAQQSDHLAIELRFGHYLKTSEELGADKLLRYSNWGQLTLFLAFVINIWQFIKSLFEATPSQQTSSLIVSEDSKQEDEQTRQFLKFYKNANCSPYVRKSNLLLMCQRLKLDGHLEKVTKNLVNQPLETKSTSTIKEAIFITNELKSLANLSENLNGQIIVVSNNIKAPLKISKAAQVFPSNVDILVHHPWIERLLNPINNQENSCQTIIKINLKQFKLINQQFMSTEEKLSVNLKETYDKYATQLKRLIIFSESLDKFMREKLASNPTATFENFNKCFRYLSLRNELMVGRLMPLQAELEELWLQIEKAGTKQGFRSTNLKLNQIEYDQQQAQWTNGTSQLNLFEKLQSAFSNRFGQLDELDESQAQKLDRFQSQLNRAIKSNQIDESSTIENYRLQTEDQVKENIEDSSSLPNEELERRKRLSEWLNSLRLRVSHDNWLTSHDLRIGLLLQDQNLTLNLQMNKVQTQQVKLQFELFSSSAKMFDLISTRFQSRNLEAMAELEIGLLPPSRHRENLVVDFKADNLRASMKLEFAVLANTLEKDVGNGNSRSIIEELYENFFIDETSCAKLGIPREIKMAKLMNLIEPSLLVTLLGNAHARDRQASYCLLNPFVGHFSDVKDSSGEFETFKSTDLPIDSQSTRAALLSWRWLMNENNPRQVYLSERENSHLTSEVPAAINLQALRIKMKERSSAREPAQESGYKLIEFTRLQALECVAQCERLIEQLLATGRQMQLDAQLNPQKSLGNAGNLRKTHTNLKDILIEPTIKVNTVNFREVAQALRLFVPRQTARRPLMPDRRRQWRRQRQDTKLGQLVELSLQQPLDNAGHTQEVAQVDVEQAAFNQWKSALVNKRQMSGSGDNLRLLVTIQQAQNVPLRLMPNTNNYPMRSPNSPLFSLSPSLTLPSSPTFNAGGGQQLQQAYLTPPTSYVEVIFQRKQLASSLAQGKNPAWNETLFFDVDAPPQRASESKSALLVDEFLQLNLYDCRCYLQDTGASRTSGGGLLSPSPSQMPTMLMLDQQSLDYNNPLLNATPNRLLMSQRQRIERHLIGSLRLPLTLLLSSGRIEGPFALNQPLLLDNYQFGEQTSMSAFNQRKLLARTQLSLFITLDPQISMPLYMHLPLESCEQVDLFVYIRFWEQLVLNTRFGATNSSRQQLSPALATVSGRLNNLSTPASRSSRRHIRALALGEDARYRLISRYLMPLEPPEQLLDLELDLDEEERRQDDILMRRLARFVSLLSPLKYGLFKMRLLAPSVWFDSQQLLSNALGGPEEKAVLLCNYFLYLGKCCALLLCDALPSGRSVFVLVWSTNEQLKRDQSRLESQLSDLLENLSSSQQSEQANKSNQRNKQWTQIDWRNFMESLPILINSRTIQIWDPNTGLAHTLSDPMLPLISVGSIVTCENVYANIQPSELPRELTYDIRQSNSWLPLFTGAQLNQPQLVAQGGALEATLQRDAKRLASSNARRRLNYLENLSQKMGRPNMAPLMASEALNSLYNELMPSECDELKSSIEQSIKAHLLKWRPNRPTYFNRTMSRIIAERLATFEQTYCFYKSSKQSSKMNGSSENATESVDEGEQRGEQQVIFADWRSDLAELIRSEVVSVSSGLLLSTASAATANLTTNHFHERQVISWPVNLTYTNMRSILDALFASGVHQADLMLDNVASYDNQSDSLASHSLSTQFLVACHVEAYPARIMSIWLYVGAIVAEQSAGRLNSVLI